ncbi:MAG: PAS domain S-box protein [Verrucomicrobia bacterium]|nr:PAS domain S-box protein [Verrucomicrobiota bacterium]
MPPTFATSEPRATAAPGAPVEADARRSGEAPRQTLFRLVEQLSAATSPPEAARFIAAATEDFFRWDAFSLTHYLPESDLMELVFGMDILDGVRTEVPIEDLDPHASPLARRVIAEGAKLILRGSGSPDALVDGRPFGDKSRRSASLMFAPIRRGPRVLGILSVQSYRPNAYVPEDLEMLQAVADLCSGAMERIRAEQALRESGARLAFAQRLAGLGSFERDLRTGRVVWSAEHYRIWGRDPAAAPPTMEEIFAAIHPEDRELARLNFQKLTAGGAPFDQQYRILRPDGHVRHIIARTQTELDRAGRPVRIVGTVQDVTERALMEEAVRASEERYRLLADHTDDFVSLVDSRGHRLYISPSFYRATGWTPEDLERTDWRTRVHPDDVKRVEEADAAGHAGQATTLEHRFLCRDGAWLWLERKSKPLLGPDGRVQSLLGCSRNITARKQMEEALRASEERYRLLADHTDDFVALNDTQGNRLYISPSYHRVTGWTLEEIHRTDWRTRVHPDDLLVVERARAANVAGQATTIEHRVKCRDGSWLWMELRCNPLPGSDGRVQHLLTSSRDITARKQAEAEIRGLNESLERRVRERTTELETAIAALRESESQLRLSLDASNAGTWSWEVATNVAQWDDKYHELYGFAPHEAISHAAWLARIHPDDRARLGEEIQALLRPGAPGLWNQEFRVLHPQRGVRWMIGLGRVERDAAGTARRFTGINLDITGRKRAEEEIHRLNQTLEQRVTERTTQLETANDALRSSEERFRTFMENSPALAWIKDEEGRYAYLNAAYEQCFNVRLADWRGKTDFDVYPRDTAELFRENDRRVLDGGRHLETVEHAVGPDGRRIYWAITKFPIRDAAGRRYVGGIGLDITERRRAEEELRERESRLRAMNDASPLGVFVTDTQGLCLYTNRAYHELSGLTFEQSLGKGWERMIHPDDHQRAIAEWYAAVATQPFHHDSIHRYVHASGRIVLVRVRCAPMLDGELTLGYVGTVEDITEQQTREKALRLQAAALEKMSDALLVSDPEGRITDCNPAAERMFGYARAELIGQTPALFHRPAEQATLTAAIRAGVRTHGHWRGEINFVRKDGTAGVCETISVPLFGPDGEITATFGVNRDITERRRLEREIMEISDRERDRIGQDLHDGLCQHLVGIAYTANQLAKKLGHRAAAETAGADQIAVLLDEAITQSRQLARGLYPVSLETEGLAAALRELGDQVTQRFELTCEVKAEHEGPVGGHVVATHLFRIAQEAVSNAVKHAQASWILIHLAIADGRIHVRVTDNGIGLSATSAGNAGMGLHTMNYRAAAIGGSLDISPAPGGGTVVSCSAPLLPTKP